MPFLLIMLWFSQHFIVALTLAVSSPAAASTVLSFSEPPLATGATIPQKSNSNLTIPPSFNFRVPFSTIELYIECIEPMNGTDLTWILLSIHEYTGEHLREKGDGPLAPKQDPFGFLTDPPRLSFTAQSVRNRLMKWSILQIAAEGLYLALPQAHRDFAANFTILDYQDKFQWGFGEVKAVPSDSLGIQTPAIIVIGNDTSSATGTEHIASQVVPAA